MASRSSGLRVRRAAGVGLAALLSLLPLVAGCSAPDGDHGDPGGTRDAPAGSSLSPQAESVPVPQTVADGLEAPWSIVFIRGTALVSQRDDGRVLELIGAGTEQAATREAGRIPGVEHGGEGGLLGLAVREDRGRTWLYAYSTGVDGNRIQRLELTGTPGALALGPAETILEGVPAAGHHNGGRIAFGPDGMLYAGTGDAGDPASAQDPDALAGKILRLTPDGHIPADNPDPASPVYSRGHRNVQGLAWSADGTMFATEFGQNTWDELNVIEAGSNYGWPEAEGITGGTGAERGFIDPVQQWAPDAASPSGLAAAGGTLYVANLRGRVLRTVPAGDPTTSTEHWDGRYGRLRDAVVSPDGDVWVLTNNTDGRGRPGREDDRILAFTPPE